MADNERSGGGVKRAARGYVSALSGACKGALGAEFVRAGRGMVGAAGQRLRLRTCPRCFEPTLQKVDGGYQCIAHDICGLQASEQEVAALSNFNTSIHPVVYAIAKGQNFDVTGQQRASLRLSWVAWVLLMLLVAYALSWLLDGDIFFGTWVGFVAAWVWLFAVRLAYRAQYLSGAFSGSPKEFFKSPGAWFPLQ